MKGIYYLLINLKRNVRLNIGALGKIRFRKGRYVYVGSAQNNVEKRVQRHMSKNKKLRWHIDYLLASSYAKVENAFYKKAAKNIECRTADFLADIAEPVSCFGCSDCRCNSHLFRLKSIKPLDKLEFKEL
jgi:Uri superfamily endonuclease